MFNQTLAAQAQAAFDAAAAPGKPLNIGRALRVAIVMYRSRKGVHLARP